MAENSTAPTKANPLQFIAGIRDDARREDCKALLALMGRVTGAPPVMWGAAIVGFGSYHYKYASGREGDWMLVGFAPRRAEIVIYLMGEIAGQAALLARLGPHRMGKACLYVKRLEEIDQAVLEELTRKSVAALKAAYPPQPI